jgi:hypothetical protein
VIIMLTTTYMVYCYEGDAPLLEPCIKGINHASPKAPIYLVDDANNPCPVSIIKGIIKDNDNVTYMQTLAQRNGNLRGIRWLIDQVGAMRIAAERTGSVYIDKIDPDHLLMRNLYDDHLPTYPDDVNAPILYGIHCKTPPATGMHYRIKASALRPLMQYLIRRAEWQQDKEADSLPEDATLATALLTMGTACIIDATPGAPACTVKSWHPLLNPYEPPEECYHLDAINFGRMLGYNQYSASRMMSALYDTLLASSGNGDNPHCP